MAAMPFYKRLGEQKTEDRRLQIEMGVTMMDLAVLHINLGDMDAVCDDYQRMIELFDALSRSNPDELEVEFYLARGHLGLGNTYANMGKMEIAERELQTAMKRIDGLVASASNPESRHLQALVSLNLGQFLSRNQRFEESEQKYRRAIAIWQETPPPAENAIGGADIFAMASNALGVLQAQQQRIEEAEQSFSASCAEYHRLIALQPRDHHGLKRGLSSSLENLAMKWTPFLGPLERIS
jgi:tetratricopeptide (TPR) repeat protein